MIKPVAHPPRRRLSDEVRDWMLAELVLSGDLEPGDRLPSEAELCARYNVSRITVRAALRSLQDAGYIAVRHGRGSMLLPRADSIAAGLDRLCPLETFAAESGNRISSTDQHVEAVSFDDRTARLLGVRAGSPGVVVRRTELYGGTPVGRVVEHVPDGVLPPSRLREPGAVLDRLLTDVGVEYTDCDLTPVVLDRELAEALSVDVGSPALHLDELARVGDGRIVARSQAWLLPEHFRFALRRRRQE
ncbi:GntR family transcriptional regulator [Saccharopolyspora cebuensis]|uniref:GntR family transcriptional regulator n=1 Tax=Saccharopolyspora cebuensis TaxID=418759 RepID=A0ABV4CBF5_9PSEU